MNRAGLELGLASWRLPGPPSDALRTAREVGASFVQLDLGDGAHRGPRLDDPEIIDGVLAAVAATGVPVTALSVNALNDIGLTRRDAAGRRSVAEVLRTAVRTATVLGCRHLLVPSFRRSRIADAGDLGRTATCLRGAVDLAAAEGIVVATENVLAPPALTELLSRVGHPALTVLVDTGNLSDAGVPVDMYCRAARDRILEHVHVKGPNGGAEALAPGLTDRMPWHELLLGPLAGVTGLVLESDHRHGSDKSVAADLRTLRRCTRGGRDVRGSPR